MFGSAQRDALPSELEISSSARQTDALTAPYGIVTVQNKNSLFHSRKLWLNQANQTRMKPCGYMLGLLLLLPWSVAAQNRVLELDGNESWVELPADLLKDVKNELTVEGWIRWQRLGEWSRFFDFGPADK